ncbi:MAG: protein-glutamate O-methyltransferase [Planctomycetes bacterium]|nr:protein-glutamate O-methyltransferase [Planctomycetota bacterium]
MIHSLLQEFNLTDKEFELISKLVYSECGIKLSKEKNELVKSRLTKRLKKYGFRTFEEYYEYVTAIDKTGNELVCLIDCISTNKTEFFREKAHFDFLDKEFLPDLIEEKIRGGFYRLRGWSAGCSTGEEPFSIAITVCKHLDIFSRWDVKILATDISTRVIEKAKQGIYEKEKLETLPQGIVKTHFICTKEVDTAYYSVKEYLRKMVLFGRLNLMDKQFPFTGQFDFIFCRNVMIYFDKATQRELVSKFHKYLAPGGYLFIGHSESLTGIPNSFEYIQPTVYRKSNVLDS